MSAKTKTTTEPGLTLADVSGLTAAATADMFAAKMKVMRRAFVENGKLIYHLDTIKLRAGQTVYGMLKSRGVSEGSIHSARTVANLIAALVIPGHVPEESFDAVTTFRTARLGDLLLKGKGKTKVEPQTLAAILLSGDTSAVGAELECLHEHGMTIADREAALKAEEAERQALQAKAAEADKLRAAEAERLAAEQAEAARQAAIANTATPSNTDEDEDEETDEEPDDTDEDADEDADEESEDPDTDEDEDADEESEDPDTDEDEEEESTPAPVIVNGPGTTGTTPAPKAPTPPPAPTVTLAGVVDRINSALIDAMDLNPQDMEKLVAFLRQSTDELSATLQSMEAAA